MSWKKVNGYLYYYESRRVGRKVKSVYRGNGALGLLASFCDQEDREEKRERAEAWRAERQALDRDDRDQAERFRRVEMFVRLVIEAAGFRRHDRGQWRRSRAMADIKPAEKEVGPRLPALKAELEAVFNRVVAGDESAEPRARELIAAAPNIMIRAYCGELDFQVERARLAKLRESSPIFGVSVPAKLDALRAELGGKDPSPIERLLVERCVGCWLDLHMKEMYSAEISQEPIHQADYRDRALSRAQARYLAAMKSLAVVRKLGVVVVLAKVDARTVTVSAPENREDREDRPG